MGVTANGFKQKKPAQYWGVERDPAAADRLEALLPEDTAPIIGAQAEHSGLPGRRHFLSHLRPARKVSLCLRGARDGGMKGTVIVRSGRLLASSKK